jgi:hypothetical protein
MRCTAKKLVPGLFATLALSLFSGCLLLFAASPVAAELTPTEKEVAIEIDGAIRALEDGIVAFAPVMAESRAGDRSTQQAATLLLRAQGRLTYGLARLIHVNTEQAALADTLDTWTPAQYVASAWTRIDAGLGMLRDAQKVAPAAIQPYLTSAVARLTRLDRTQTFEAPFPIDYPQVVGPHGDWEQAQTRTSIALQSLDTAMTALVETYRASDVSPTVFPYLSGVVKRNVSVQRLYRHAMLINSMIPSVPSQDCGLNRFHLIAANLAKYVSMTSGSHGLHGAPYDLQRGIENLWPAVVEALIAAPVARAQFENFVVWWLRAWRWGDGAAWSMLEFPDEARLAEIRAQARPLAPPLCR